jgi:hypothetical protein
MGSSNAAYWFRLPDNESQLMSLRLGELRCYLVVARAIQRDKNKGKISVRQVAERSKMAVQNAHKALNMLVAGGLLACKKKPGSIAVYSLPIDWASGPNRSPVHEQLNNPNCTSTGEQLDDAPPPQSEQCCASTDEQNCASTHAQHLKYSELSESSPRRSSRIQNTGTAAAAAASAREPQKQKQPVSWNPAADERERARAMLIESRGWNLLGELDVTTVNRVLQPMTSFADFELFLKTTISLKNAKSWGLHIREARQWPANRAATLEQIEYQAEHNRQRPYNEEPQPADTKPVSPCAMACQDGIIQNFSGYARCECVLGQSISQQRIDLLNQEAS